METRTYTVYTFAELSEKAKEKAIENQALFESENFDTEYLYDAFEAIAKILGITFRQKAVKLHGGGTRYDPVIYYSGFWSQGDGACFEGSYEYAKGSRKAIREYAPTDTELHRIADEMYTLQRKNFYGLTATMTHRGHYSHSGCMRVEVEDNRTGWNRTIPEGDVTKLMRDFADWMYKQLGDEYEYRTSKEACIESIEANDYNFLESGEMA